MANGTWRIGRGRGGAQLPLVIVAVLAILLLIAGKTHLAPFERARVMLTDRSGPFLRAVNAPLAAGTRWFSGVGHFFDVYSENLRLKDDNARLLQWRGAAQSLQDRLKHYQQLLKAIPERPYSAVTAQVIARSSQPFLETLVLNAGRSNGVKPGQAVVDARGMIGRVYVAGDRTSWVILLNDLNSRVPVIVRPGNVQAILAGNNATMPSIEALPQNIRLKNDADVVTSGDGGLLPPGLPVGLLRFEGREVKVSLYADPLTASEVRVLDFQSPVEQIPRPTDRDLPGPEKVLPPPPPTTQSKPAAQVLPVSPRRPAMRQSPPTITVTRAPPADLAREPAPDAGREHAPAPDLGERAVPAPEPPADQDDQ